MLRIIGSALRTGTVSYNQDRLAAPAPALTKGRPALDPTRCDGNAACQAACPTSAIVLGQAGKDGRRSFTLDYGACVFCGRCAEACAPGALTISAEYALATLRREDLILRVEVSAGLSEENAR